ncbi:MAG: DUF885 family protein [Planctomycetota bacterium]
MSETARYEDLVDLFGEYREFVVPRERDGIPDYSASAMEAQHEDLGEYQKRLAAMDVESWPVGEQVDYHIVRAEMNGLDFNHRVIRPWSRDPGFYCTFSRFEHTMHGAVRIPGELPLSAEKLGELQAGVRKLPGILAQARSNLTEIAADFATLAIRMKQREHDDWSRFAERAIEHHPELVPDVERVVQAVDDFAGWLKDGDGGYHPRAGVGEENWNWFMKNVYLFPYTWEEAHAVVQRELERSETFMRLEEHHNRDLPPQMPSQSEDEQRQRMEGGMDRLMKFLDSARIFKDSEFIKPMARLPGYWPYDPGKLNFFQEVLCRGNMPLNAHDVCGHSHDGRRYSKDERPIRSVPRPYHINGLRAEGLATGIEEILTHLGLLDDRPRSRELTYVLVSFRAARAAAAMKMHRHELDFKGGLDYAARMTARGYSKPDTFLLWDDLELYIRQPGYGMGYLMGKVQLEKLISDYSRIKGDDFSLRDCFTEFLDAGFIPISLIRWEITGLTDEMEVLLR